MRARSIGAWRIKAVVAAALLVAMAVSPQGAEATTRRPTYQAPASQQDWADWHDCGHRSPDNSELGAAVVFPGQPVIVTIILAETVGTNDLSLVDELGNTAEPMESDTKAHEGGQYVIKNLMQPWAANHVFAFSIFNRENGLTFSSRSRSAIAIYGDHHDRYICFEDGNPDQDFDDLIIHIQMVGDLTSLPPSSTNPFEVDVRYDDVAMFRLTHSPDANVAIARGVENRALKTLAEYQGLLGASGQDAVPSHIQIVISDNSKQYGLISNPGAKTECSIPGVFSLGILFDLGSITGQQEVQDYAKAYSSASGPFTPQPGLWLATTIDHELWHTIQCNWTGPVLMGFQLYNGNDSNVEGSATAAQDAIADTDDSGYADTGTFGIQAKVLLGRNGTPTGDIAIDSGGGLSYAAGPFYEYLAEHYETGSNRTLEQKLVDFLLELSTGFEDHLTNVAYAMAKQWPDEVREALRDFEVAAYIHNHPNVSFVAGDRFRIFDETTTNGSSTVGRDQTVKHTVGTRSWDQAWTDVDVANKARIPSGVDYSLLGNPKDTSRTQVANSATLWELAVDPGATVLRIRLSGANTPNKYYVAAIPSDSAGNVVVDPARLFRSGQANMPLDLDVPVAGMAKVGLVIVSADDFVKDDFIIFHHSFPLKLTLRTTQVQGTPTLTMSPVGTAAASSLPGAIPVLVQPAYGGVPVTNLPVTSFRAEIDGAAASVSSEFDVSGSEELFVQAPALSPGSHQIKVCLAAACQENSFYVGPVVFRAGADGYMDVRPATSQASVSTLQGDYGLYATLDATHAGSPFAARAVLVRQGEPVTGARVQATVTDPNGVIRHFVLNDSGAWTDGGTDDGQYGASVLGTNALGIYSVEIAASGTDASGIPFSLSGSTSISLDAMVDSDGDGIADDMEVQLGLDPHNAADASVDLDGDGLGTLQELAIGCDPLNPDTDLGGEPDGSEVARGHDPLVGADDATIPTVRIAAMQNDGRQFSVTVVAGDGNTPIRLYRVSGQTSVDLGLQPGSGTTITDGPLPAGDYFYQAVAELPNGAKSSPKSSPVLPALEDATPPDTNMAINGANWTTSQRDVGITFYDASETLASMRIATTPDGLASASWVPYEKYTYTTLAATPGIQTVYAQVRDMSGLESGVLIRTIDYEPGAFQVDRSSLSAQAVDTDGDGKYEALRLAGQIAVRDGGICRVSAALLAPDGSAISSAHQTIHLRPRTDQIWIDFPGVDIVAAAKSGPYTVSGLQILCGDELDSDASPLMWPTPTYQVSQFVAAPGSQVTSAWSASGPINLTVESTEPYEIWGHFKAAGASSFDPWRQMGAGTPGVNAQVTVPQGDGTYEFYSLAISSTDGAREAIPPMADYESIYDQTPPTSTLTGAVPSRTAVAEIPISVSSADSMGIYATCVLTRYRATQDDSWSSWSAWNVPSVAERCVLSNSGVIDLTLPAAGFYEFMTQAIDNDGRQEALKNVAQAETHYTTGSDPASHVMSLPVHTNQTSFTVPYKADFASGTGRVDLYARFEKQGGTTFTDWEKIATTTYPNQLTAPLTQGDGRYELSTVAIDAQSGLSETRPTNADAYTNLDTVVPISSMEHNLPGSVERPPVYLEANSSDVGSGLAEIRFYYRYKSLTGQDFGDWKQLASTSDPGPWGDNKIDCPIAGLGLTYCRVLDFVPIEGDGYYEVSSVAVDVAGNVEAKEPAKAAFLLDSTVPTVNVTVPRATKSTYTSITYTASDPAGIGSIDLYMQFTQPGGSPGDWGHVRPVSSSPVSVQLTQGQGMYSFFLSACDAVGNCYSDLPFVQASIILDTTAPTTSLTSLPAHISSPSQTLSYTAGDGNGSGVQSLQVQRQFKASGGSFGSWSTLSTVSDPLSSGTVALTLTDGYGTYHFRTIATDYAGNVTTGSTTSDTVLDAPIPVTQAGPLAAAVKSTSLSVPYTVTAGAPTSVQLYQRWTTPGGTPSGNYTLVSTKTSPGTSGTFAVTLTNPGLYEFYTLGVGSTGTESAPATADATTILDIIAPTSAITAPASTSSGASISIPYTASDNTNGSGLASVECWSRYKTADGATPGAWTSCGSNPQASGSLTLTFSGAGIYDVLTVAVDVAGNREGSIANPPAAAATPKSSVRSIAWIASAKVNTDTGTALQDNAAYVVGSDGTLYAVWEDSRNGNTDIYFSSRNPTTGVWAAETKLNTDTGTTGQRTPSIAIDSSNNLYVVWADDRNGATNTDIYFAKRTGTTWSANIKVNSDTGTAIQNAPRISVGSGGVAVAVWYDARSSQVNIYSARLAVGSTTWSANYKVTSNTAAVKAAPDVTVASDGTAWATWQDNQSGAGDIFVASLGPSATTWSTNTKVSDDTVTTALDKSPRIGLTSGNVPIVAYLDGRTTNAQVRVTKLNGTTWNATVQVSDASAKPATGLALAVKADGGVIVAWDDTRSTSAIYGAQCEAGSGTTSVTRCGPNEKWSDQTGPASHPVLVASTSKVYLGWRDDTAGGGDIRIRLRNPS